MDRQKIRKTILLISFLLFPIVIWYFSPYLIIQAAFQHILNGSFFVFLVMFVLSPFFGRIWCGYFCAAGGLQEICSVINEKSAKQGQRNKIKFVIWTIWIITIILTFILGTNHISINFFYMTDHGISISNIYSYIIYYAVILILVLPSIIHGKRATCHYICWMAPFMIIGSKIGKKLNIPQMHIESKKNKCISCKKCNKICPMGIDVELMIKQEKTSTNTECIQCGACIDKCPNEVLEYKFS